MAALALAEALPDFGAEIISVTRPAHSPEPVALTLASGSETDRSSGHMNESENRVAEAVQTAESALRARLEEEHAALLAAERQRFQDELDAARQAMGTEAGLLVRERLDQAQAQVLSVTSQLTARILGMALTEDLRRRAIGELERVIGAALVDRATVAIRVSGPAHLFEPLKSALGERTSQLVFVESDALDLTVAIDEELYETRLAEWSAALSEALS